jgi:hypothetical protein
LGPVVRDQLAVKAPDLALTSFDWPNIIDEDAWRVERTFGGSILTVGRHTRDSRAKWPSDPEEIRTAYPLRDNIQIANMGGHETPAALLGEIPMNWVTYEFDGLPVERFLAGLDIYTYLHHPDLLEAFGRNVLEAMASGLAPIIPSYMRPTFGEGPFYVGSGSEAAEIYMQIEDDRNLLRERSSQAAQSARDRFSPGVHVDLVANLIGPPRKGQLLRRRAGSERPARGSDLPTVLIITDNGHGLGHLTRMIAVTRTIADRTTPFFLTLSKAFPILQRFDIPGEYFPSATTMGVSKKDWQELFGRRLVTLMRDIRPSVVVVDHVAPPTVLNRIIEATSGAAFVWSRRGLWRSDRNQAAIDQLDQFDHIVEPGDLASPIDVGLTRLNSAGVVVVPPIVLIEDGEKLSREDAREALGIPSEGRAFLVQLVDSDPVTLREMISKTATALRRATGEAVTVFAPAHPLHGTAIGELEYVLSAAVYPVARYHAAFDGVVSAAGYNSFHEVVGSGLPAVFVARDNPSLDDQDRRAEFAELSGLAFYARSIEGSEFGDAISRMVADGEKEIARDVASLVGKFDGAVTFGNLLADLALSHSDGFALESVEFNSVAVGVARSRLRSGSYLAPTSMARVGIVVIFVHKAHDDQLQPIADKVAALQNERQSFKPVFVLASQHDPKIFEDHGFIFETLMDTEDWSALSPFPYGKYLRNRVADIALRLKPQHVVSAACASEIDEWLFS